LVNDDGGQTLDTGEIDGGPTVLIDAEGQDVGELDTSAIDTMVVMLDVAVDTADAEPDQAPDQGPDMAPDLARDLPPNAVPCSSVQIVSIGAGLTSRTYQADTRNSFCFATCDDISGWTCSQMADRQIYLNGQLIPNCAGNPTIPAKFKGTHHVFQVSAGIDPWSSITWWMPTAATGAACEAPAGGFGLE
jgi:hypothetical protein